MIRARRLRVEITHAAARYLLVDGEPLEIVHHGTPLRLVAGERAGARDPGRGSQGPAEPAAGAGTRAPPDPRPSPGLRALLAPQRRQVPLRTLLRCSSPE